MNVQERLQLKRIPLDKWSHREQLCLAMAVLCSGDQNWMSVSRALKMMCGTNRPTDWFSQKFCAAQYGKLLENVETPKRKKRTATERDNPEATTATTIIPGELIVRKLVQERTAELKKLVEDEQKEYRQLAHDIRLLQSDTMDDAQVLAMWEQIENENREKEKEQQRHAQWLREREEKKIEMERAWRPGAVVQASMSPTSNSNSSGSPSRNSPSMFLKNSLTTTPKVEPMEMESVATPDTPLKQGTSPLLTSLLKSPSSSSSSNVHNTNSISGSTSAARALAPTITNLLTGGQNPQQSVQGSHNLIPQNVANSSSSFFNFQSQHPKHQQATIVTQPSKAAPTLSKLLDPNRNKGDVIGIATTTSDEDVINIDDDQQLMEVFKELMPDDLADILTDNNEMIVSPELLDQDLENVTDLIHTTGNQGSSVQGGGPVNVTSVEVKEEVSVPEVIKVEVKEEEHGVSEEVLNVPASKNDSAEAPSTGFNEQIPPVASEVQTGTGTEEPTITPQENPEFTTNTSTNEVADSVAVLTDDDDMMELDDTVTPTDQNEDNNHVPEDVSDEVKVEPIKVEEEVQDNLEEQLEAITNGSEVVKEVKREVEEKSKILSVEGNVKTPEATEKSSSNDQDVICDPQENINKGTESVPAEIPKEEVMKEQQVMEEQSSSSPDPPLNPPPGIIPTQDSEMVDSEKKAMESEQIKTGEPTAITTDKIPEENIKPSLDDDNSLPSRTEDRKVSTDNEDQFEDAKSTVEELSGNSPEDIEMNNVSLNNKDSESGAVEVEEKVVAKNLPTSPVVVIPTVTETSTPTESHSDRNSRSKRDMPRRNRSQTSTSHDSHDQRHSLSQTMVDSGEETTKSSSSASTNLSTLRTRLKERDRSESPLVMDEDTSDLIIPRTRRRYSSTPVIDSVPSSPAGSGDDREYKNWKKTVLIAFNQFSTLHYKYSAVLVQQIPEEFRDVILRPMDMQTIKKSIETGVYRTTQEFQRDVLLMVHNAIMMNTRRDRDWMSLIEEMMVEVGEWRRETEKNLNGRGDGDGGMGTGRDAQGKVRNRKSMRITTAA